MKQKLTKNKLLLPAIAVGLVVAGALLWHQWHKSKVAVTATGSSPASTTASNTSTAANSDINYGPPTSGEKQEASDYKKTLSSTPSSSSSSPSISIQVIEATKSRVSANVMGVFEDGGACTATFTKGSQQVTDTGTGVAASNYTQCNINVPAGQITDSGWSVIVSYSSAKASGQSAATPITG